VKHSQSGVKLQACFSHQGKDGRGDRLWWTPQGYPDSQFRTIFRRQKADFWLLEPRHPVRRHRGHSEPAHRQQQSKGTRCSVYFCQGPTTTALRGGALLFVLPYRDPPLLLPHRRSRTRSHNRTRNTTPRGSFLALFSHPFHPCHRKPCCSAVSARLDGGPVVCPRGPESHVSQHAREVVRNRPARLPEWRGRAAGRGPPAPQVVVVLTPISLSSWCRPSAPTMSLPGNKSLEEHDPVLFDLIEQVCVHGSYGRSPLVGWLKRRISGYRPTPLAVRSLTMPARPTGEGPSVPLPGADRLRELHLARCDGLPRQRADQQGGRPAVFIPAEAPHARD
jgi:hypothetical protein